MAWSLPTLFSTLVPQHPKHYAPICPTHVCTQSSKLDRSHILSPYTCSPLSLRFSFLLYLTIFQLTNQNLLKCCYIYEPQVSQRWSHIDFHTPSTIYIVGNRINTFIQFSGFLKKKFVSARLPQLDYEILKTETEFHSVPGTHILNKYSLNSTA